MSKQIGVRLLLTGHDLFQQKDTWPYYLKVKKKVISNIGNQTTLTYIVCEQNFVFRLVLLKSCTGFE